MAPVARPWMREDGPDLGGLFSADPLPSWWLRRRLEWSIQEERRMTDLGTAGLLGRGLGGSRGWSLQEERRMTDLGAVVIIGGGLAGAKPAEALRERGFDGTVVLA